MKVCQPVMRFLKEGDTSENCVRLGLTEHGLLDTSNLATCHIAARNRHTSRLLLLPAELRNNIFTMVLQEPCLQVFDIVIDRLTADTALLTEICHGELRKTLVPDDQFRFYSTLSPVCRQIYDETCLLPYALNSFGFSSIEAMQIWLSGPLPIQLQQITTFKAPSSFEHFYLEDADCKLTHVLPRLEVLYIDLWNARSLPEMDGWSADDIEQCLQDETEVLLDKEKSGLKIVVTEYMNLGMDSENILRAA